MRPKIFLTFDCEDFINDRSIFSLQHILNLLNKHNIKGLFFITGHMAEKIKKFPNILTLLDGQEIGYHSTAHSVRPTIIEYTDVENYETALKISLERETKHINQLTGECEGIGGIFSLHDLFPNKKITSFRAPFFAYSPPHLEAMKEFGIKYDFSTNLSERPISYENLTFNPYPKIIDRLDVKSYVRLLHSLIKSVVVVCDFHPNQFVNDDYWDSIYFSGNPERLYQVKTRSQKVIDSRFRNFENFLLRLIDLQKRGFLEITTHLEEGKIVENFTKENVIKSYQMSVDWVKRGFGYRPVFVIRHFLDFFKINY